MAGVLHCSMEGAPFILQASNSLSSQAIFAFAAGMGGEGKPKATTTPKTCSFPIHPNSRNDFLGFMTLRHIFRHAEGSDNHD